MTDTTLPAELPPMFNELTPREQAFILHPEVMTNAQKAAIDVGYAESTARHRAASMRKQLMHYIRPVHAGRLARHNITVERVMDELAAIAFVNAADFYDKMDTELVTREDGTVTGGDTVHVLKDFKLLPEHLQRAIKDVDFETFVTPEGESVRILKRLSLHDKQTALGKLVDMILKLHTPESDWREEQQQVLEGLEPEELEIVTRLYLKAAERMKAAANAKRDRTAIPGEVSVTKAKASRNS